jgi:SAM-dependent methyltransferase
MRPWRAATSSEPELSREPAYRLERCPDCGTAALADRLEEPDTLYTRGTYVSRGRLDRLIEPLRRAIDLDRVRLLPRLPPGARVFEVGAGDGRLVEELGRRGLAARGADPQPPPGASALVEREAIEDLSPGDGAFDAVVAWHVIEHLDDPSAELAHIRRWLAPRGQVVVAVPNLDSVQARLGGDRWFHQDVPRHRVQLTLNGLRRMLERNGFEVRSARHLLLEHNLLGMWQTLLNRLTLAPNAFFRFLKRQPHPGGSRGAVRDGAVVALAGPVLVPVAVILELAAAAYGRGGTVVVTAAVPA